MFWRRADYLPDSLPDWEICNHDSLASEWSDCGPAGHLICCLISPLNRKNTVSILLIVNAVIVVVTKAMMTFVRRAFVDEKKKKNPANAVNWGWLHVHSNRAAISSSFSPPFMLTPARYSVGRFDTSPGENTWNAIKPVVGLVCASCKPPLVNTTVGCTQVHWLGWRGLGEGDALQKMSVFAKCYVVKSDDSILLFCRNKTVKRTVGSIIWWKKIRLALLCQDICSRTCTQLNPDRCFNLSPSFTPTLTSVLIQP